jgi:hypothetical protein
MLLQSFFHALVAVIQITMGMVHTFQGKSVIILMLAQYSRLAIENWR